MMTDKMEDMMSDIEIPISLKTYGDMWDRIEELESQGEWMEGIIDRERAEVERLRTTLKKLEYWLDTDEEILNMMSYSERADHMHKLNMVRNTLYGGNENGK